MHFLNVMFSTLALLAFFAAMFSYFKSSAMRGRTISIIESAMFGESGEHTSGGIKSKIRHCLTMSTRWRWAGNACLFLTFVFFVMSRITW